MKTPLLPWQNFWPHHNFLPKDTHVLFNYRRRCFQTTRSGTLGQRTATTHSCGAHHASGITSAGGLDSCHGSGSKPATGNVLFANCSKYSLAMRKSSLPPRRPRKIWANFIQLSFFSAEMTRNGMTPYVEKSFVSPQQPDLQLQCFSDGDTVSISLNMKKFPKRNDALKKFWGSICEQGVCSHIFCKHAK